MVSKIAEELKAVDWDMNEVRFSVLAHSLGTAVAHDTLHRLATKPINQLEDHGRPNTALQPPGFRFHSYFAVANVSRVLWPNGRRIENVSRVRPPVSGLTGNRYYLNQTFRNFRHVADPVPAFWRFGPTGWGDRFMNVDIRHYRDINVHDLVHYLKHPGVYIRIFTGLLGNNAIPNAEIQAVANAWKDYEGPLANAKKSLVDLTEGALDQLAGQSTGAPDPAKHLVELTKALFDWKNAAKQAGL
jgi:hypothetical protein